MKKILLITLLLFLGIANCQADELSSVLVSKRQIKTKPLVVTDELSVPDNSEIDVNYKEEKILPIFKPYQLEKGEVVFSQSQSYINAIDPTIYTNKSASYLPGIRGTNQLIIYTSKFGNHTNTNEFGAEAVVNGNVVTELSGADSYIPEDGVVISGHGRAKTWINSNLKVGTKIYIDKELNNIYAYTTSESYIFETEKKISEAENLLYYYKATSPDYNWKLPNSYINDAKEYLKKAKKNTNEVQKYSQLAIDSANDALKSVLPYKNGELKGVWLRPTEKTEVEIVSTIERLKQAGIDNVFLETYFHGKTIFPSKTMQAYGFTEQYETFKGIDPLAIWIREAHKRGMKIHTWFETFYVGNQNPNDNPQSILAMNPSWGNKTKKDINNFEPSKSTSEHNGYFLDPSNPYVQDFLLKLAEEIITTYKPDGINVDYIRYPNCVASNELSNWGYTDYARNDFMEIYGVDPAGIRKNDSLWKDWDNYRTEQISNMVKKFGQLGRRTNTYISTVIFPDRQGALITKHQDWKTWSTRGYVNGFTPLFLTCDSKMAHSMMLDVINVKSPNTDFYAGLFVTFMGGSDEDLIRQIHEARKLNAKGVILFDYAHLNNKYINTLSKSVFASHSPIKQQGFKIQQNIQKQTPTTTPTHKGWWIFGKE